MTKKKTPFFKFSCSSNTYDSCVIYQGYINKQSVLKEDNCNDIGDTTEDIYKQLEELHDSIKIESSELDCSIKTDKNIKIKDIVILQEKEICSLKRKIEHLEKRSICDFKIADCGLDLKDLNLECNKDVDTIGDLLQALINKIYE